jgi:very-short-patch-repair endonuclease
MRLRVGVALGKTVGMTSAVPKPGESLADLFPDVAVQWHPTKNGGKSPDQVRAFSNKTFWWICDKSPDHQWTAIVNNRTSKASGCPMCAGRLASVTNSVSSKHPRLVKEWHPTKNDDLTPDQVTSTSHRKVWWKCPKAPDHEWRSECRTRTGDGHGGGGYGCPFCDGKRVSITNRLSTLFPEVSASWHPLKNGEITPDQIAAGANKKYWWICDRGPDHEWATSANKRTYGDQGCPFCQHVKLSVTNSLATLHPSVAELWHPQKNGDLNPSDVIAGAGKKLWWICDQGPDHEWLATANSLVSAGSRCPCCAHQKLSVTNSLETLYPLIAEEWHPSKNGDLNPSDVIAGTHQKPWWQCPVVGEHEWQTKVANRVHGGSGCPNCTLTPRSAQEMRLAHELSALIDFDLDGHKVRFAGQLRDVDIVLDNLKVVVEFDGAYWHSKRVDKDREKTALMEEAGWQVIRVRERPLDSIHVNDVMVDAMAPAKTVADLVLNKIVEVTGTDVPQLDEYLASEGPWREAQALKAIRAYQAERAAKKAARAKKN